MMTAVERAREAWGMDALPADDARHDRLMTAIRRVEPVRPVAAVTPRDPFRWRNEYHRFLQTENAALRARIVSIRRARQIGGTK